MGPMFRFTIGLALDGCFHATRTKDPGDFLSPGRASGVSMLKRCVVLSAPSGASGREKQQMRSGNPRFHLPAERSEAGGMDYSPTREPFQPVF
jgi:hypothetical protein